MRKYGKYEKRPEKPVIKQPAGNDLLQSYFTSLLSLVLCVSMFFGTSYAWFTSEVNNVGNEIYIGTLDVELEKQTADGTWKSLSELTDGVNTTKLFDGQIRWEPGYTMLETIRVINEGNLAFNYALSFTDGKMAEGSTESIETVAEAFDVWVYHHKDANDVPAPANYGEITAEDSGWVSAGNLAEALNGKPVFAGKMAEADVIDNATAHTYTVALHMREEAGGEKLMGQKVSLNVKLIAYQMTSEGDAFGNVYDNVMAVSNAEDLVAALYAGGNVVLTSDIDLEDKQITVPAGVTAMLELNGHTLSQTKEQTAAYAMITNKGTLTISDNVGSGKIIYTDIGTGGEYASNTIRNEGVLNITGGTVENLSSDAVATAGYPHAIDVYQGSTTNITGGTIKSANYDAIRMFCNSDTAATTVNISGGKIVNRVTFQNPSTNAAGYGVLNITGGEFTTANGVTANIRLLNFSSDYSNMKATISGGTFDKGIKIQNHSSGNVPTMSEWLTVNDLILTEPAEGGDIWTIG